MAEHFGQVEDDEIDTSIVDEGQLAQFGLMAQTDDELLIQWVRCHNWAVTTEADCWGHPPGTDADNRFALYDADEDDPPIAIFSFREDALKVAQVLTQYGMTDGHG